jgi:hypothetical protein
MSMCNLRKKRISHNVKALRRLGNSFLLLAWPPSCNARLRFVSVADSRMFTDQ